MIARINIFLDGAAFGESDKKTRSRNLIPASGMDF